MTKVSPADVCDPSTSHKVAILVTRAAKMFNVVSRHFDRRPSTDVSEDVETPRQERIPPYQQSSTRRLAFGTTEEDCPKPVDDFYNNSTLANVSKVFCAVVLVTAFILVITRSFAFLQEVAANSTYFSS